MAYRRNGSGYYPKRNSKGYRKASSSSTSYGKKRRVGKKSSGKTNNRALQKIVREETIKALRGPAQRVSVTSFPVEVPICSESERSKYSYFRVPVTQVIPLQRGPGLPADDRWRRQNKVYVKGVCVRMLVSYAITVGVMGVCYPAKVQKAAISVDGEPAHSFLLGKKDAKTIRLLSLEETEFVASKDGPFSVVCGANGVAMLDSPDQSLFNCRLAKGAGAPVGEARWRVEKGGAVQKGRTFAAEFHVTSNMRTPNSGALGGHCQMDTRVIEVYWEIDKEIEFVAEMSRQPVFENHLELMFGVQALKVLSAESGSVTSTSGTAHLIPVECGRISNVMVDVYYS